jgi:4-hydroxybenzoate polyprenyltransferase
VLRWALVPACLLISVLYSVPTLYASATLTVLFVIYNELQLHARHWFLRNALNALGLMMFETGATLVAGKHVSILQAFGRDLYVSSGFDRTNLDPIAISAIRLSACMLASTYHVQDFKDVEGDRLIGRRTLPIVHPKQARKTIIVGLLIWSAVLVDIWELDVFSAAALISLGALVGVRFLIYKTIPDDQVSFVLYNVCIIPLR